jgi:hypothetical protein
MKAQQLARKLGQKFVGHKVNTDAWGDYPGGIAIVTEMQPAKDAPEIVFQVSLPHWGEIGVFAHEEVSMVVDGLRTIELHGSWRN